MLRHSVLSALAACAPLAASAGQATFTLSPSVTITGTCSVTNGSLSFGSMGNISTAVNATGTFDVSCTPSVHYNVGLGTGQNSASVTTRRMRLGATSSYLSYALYLDSARATNWGLSSPNVLTANGSNSARTFTVYGTLAAQTAPAAGSYSDTVQIVVSY
jgi:spore coat protein U-like protein